MGFIGKVALTGALLASSWLATDRAGAATEVRGAELSVARTDDARSCPHEGELAQRIADRLPRGASAPSPLRIDVGIFAERAGFSARIAVSGKRSGQRVLHAAGPSCEALRDALVVSLLLVLDDAPREPLPAIPRTDRSSPDRVRGWLGAGVGLTHGLPVGMSALGFAELALSYRRFELGAAGFWVPERRVDSWTGEIAVQVAGGYLKGCWLPWQHETLEIGACALGFLGRLSGEGQGYSSNGKEARPWWLAGAGPELRWHFSRRLSLGASAAVLVSLHREAFAVEPLGVGYRTDAVTGLFSTELRLRLW